jgi:DNA-binding MarR family transcriptional regulator
VLSTLWETDRQTIGAIAERLSLEASTITLLVKRIEQAGFVTRERDTVDERRVHIGLTKAGRELRPRTAYLTETLLERSGLTEAQLVDLNTRVQALRDAVASDRGAL